MRHNLEKIVINPYGSDLHTMSTILLHLSAGTEIFKLNISCIILLLLEVLAPEKPHNSPTQGYCSTGFQPHGQTHGSPTYSSYCCTDQGKGNRFELGGLKSKK